VRAGGNAYSISQPTALLELPEDTVLCYAALGDTVLHHITLYNFGGAHLFTNSVKLTDLDTSDVTLNDPVPNHILPRASTVLTLRQTGVRTLDERGTLRIESNSGGVPPTARIPIRLVVGAAQAALPPEHLKVVDFGWVPLGTFRDTVIHVFNPDAQPLKIAEQKLRGRDAGLVQIVSPLPDELPAFGRDSLILRFGYFMTVSAAGYLEIHHDALQSTPTTIQLHGETAWPSWPIPVVNNRYIDFDEVVIGEYLERVARIYNEGGIPATLLSQRIVGKDSSYFSIEKPFPSSITKRMSETSTVRFSPESTNYVSAIMECRFEDARLPMLEFYLRGQGTISTAVRERRHVPFLPRIIASYPNPFRTQATLVYTLPHSTEVAFVVHDLLGRTVHREHQGTEQAGEHRIRLVRGLLQSGMYVASILTQDGHCASRIIVVE
jgi:hypothetical protein